MELTYRQAGDYLLPNIQVPDSPKIGKYGMLRHTFLKNHRKTMLSGLQLTGKLNGHLEQIDRQATEMMEKLTTEMAKAQGKKAPEFKKTAGVRQLEYVKNEIVVKKLFDTLKKENVIE